MALLSAVVGDIPGLLRVGSPARHKHGGHLIVLKPIAGLGGMALLSDFKRAPLMPVADLRLDLTDPTGRIHAAWWIRAAIRWPETDQDEELLTCAEKGADMTPEQIDTLARLVLRLAGRAP